MGKRAMTDFFRFPTTPHLAWLAQDGMPRDDKVLSPAEAQALLSGDVVVEEKLDGANLGLSLSPNGTVRAQNRGQYLGEPYVGQFARLPAWLAQHESSLLAVLRPELMLFGEWCAARHSLDYDTLPDWFLLFDVYDRSKRRFWNTSRRNALASEAGLFTVPLVSSGRTTLAALKQLVADTPSRYRAGLPLEGVVVRRESGEWCEARAKLVRPDFAQAIDTHWSKRTIEWNRVDWTRT
jgi:ATP-dependent RNA circularization protein (DNA/RNA ligase family)